MFFEYNDQSEFKFLKPIVLIIRFFMGSFLFKKQIQLKNKGVRYKSWRLNIYMGIKKV